MHTSYVVLPQNRCQTRICLFCVHVFVACAFLATVGECRGFVNAFGVLPVLSRVIRFTFFDSVSFLQFNSRAPLSQNEAFIIFCPAVVSQVHSVICAHSFYLLEFCRFERRRPNHRPKSSENRRVRFSLDANEARPGKEIDFCAVFKLRGLCAHCVPQFHPSADRFLSFCMRSIGIK